MKFARITLALLLWINVQSGFASETRFEIQEPKGPTMDLVPFTRKLIDFPFELKYPEKWYVREEFLGVPSVFISREPIKSATDKYLVGMGLYYAIGYFVSKEPPDSKIGKLAEHVVKIVDWDESNKRYVQDTLKEGNVLISQSPLVISDQPAFRLDYESKTARITTLRIKVGNHLLLAIFEAPSKEFAQYKDVFEQMIASLHFTR